MNEDNLTQEQATQEWDSIRAEREEGTEPKPPETPPAEAKETPPATAAQGAPTEQAQVDPFEGLPAAAREKLAKFDELAAANQQLMNQLRETAGRVSKMQSEWDRSRQAQPAGGAPTQAQVAAATKDPEKWETLKKDFPEWGDGIEAFVTARIGQIGAQGPSQAQIEQMLATQAEQLNAQFETRLQHATVSSKHPGWQTTVNTPEFASWALAQAPEVRNLAESSRAEDAIRMLDLYAESKKTPAAVVKDTRQQRLQQAVTTTKPAANVPVKTLEDMTEKEAWEYYAQERAKKPR